MATTLPRRACRGVPGIFQDLAGVFTEDFCRRNLRMRGIVRVLPGSGSDLKKYLKELDAFLKHSGNYGFGDLAITRVVHEDDPRTPEEARRALATAHKAVRRANEKLVRVLAKAREDVGAPDKLFIERQVLFYASAWFSTEHSEAETAYFKDVEKFARLVRRLSLAVPPPKPLIKSRRKRR